MWQAGTYYTIKVGTGAVDAAGHPLAQPVHALFTTRAPITAQLALTDPATGGASPATGFTVSFDGPVTPPVGRRAPVDQPGRDRHPDR